MTDTSDISEDEMEAVARPRIHRVYYLLAIFDIVTVSFSLFLNHQLMGIYSDSVAENQVWSVRSTRYASLGQLAQAINSPGNDVFDSRDVPTESARVQVALAEYRIELELARDDLNDNVVSNLREPLLGRLDRVDEAINAMTKESTLIFSYFETNQTERAGQRMATMDRRYADVIKSLMQLRAQVGDIQTSHFEREVKLAANLRKFEYLIALFIILMVCAVTLYGHALARRIEAIESERNATMRRSRAAEEQLRKHETELESMVIERTEELRKSEKSLLQAQKLESLGTLAGGIAHDFNNVLQAILGFNEMASTNLNDNEIVAECLEEIEKGGRRAAELVEQILTFSRETNMETEVLKWQSHVEDSLKFIRSTIPSTISIDSKISQDCAHVKANPTQMHQVFTNLCTNAMHAMEDKGGTLTVSLEPRLIESVQETLSGQLEPGNYVELKITDTGMGILPSIFNRILDPFYTTKEAGKGTGLGLSMVHGITKSMGGGLRIRSEIGKGTTIHVILPVVSEEETREPPKDVPRPITTHGHGHIMLVDDENAITTLTSFMLSSRGFTVEAFNDVTSALEALVEGSVQYDLAILDYTMPQKTGLELARDFEVTNPDMPVIIATGLIDESAIEESRSSNIVKIIRKPYQMEFLIGVIDGVLSKA